MYSFQSVARVVVAVVVVIALSSELRAQQKPAKAPPAKADASAAAALELPDDIHLLLEHVQGVHGYRKDEPKAPSKIVRTYRSVEAALEKIHAIATEEDKQLPAYQDAMDLRLVFRTIIFSNGPRRGTQAERASLIEEIIARLDTSPNPSKDAMAAASKVGSALAFGENSQLAAQFNRQVGRILAGKPGKEAAAKAAQMLANARRSEVVGKPLKLSGTLMGGSRIDWTSYRGKVVLVEVWATWCTPCIREFPNVERNLKEYGQRGFEVVGISVDEDRQALEDFLAKHALPWPTLHDGGPEVNPFAVRYGIRGASATILVGRDGNVVSMRARGKELGRLLQELIGPPTDQKKQRD